MLTAKDNERLSQVGPGTPMGEFLRRYWYPIAAAAELTEATPTRAVRLLGEDLVFYRDRSGDYGLIGQRCAHRRVSLVYGVPEEHGLRCQYHGWMYDATGQCIEQPFEETVNPEAHFKERVKLLGYPVQELGGLVFAYLGPQPAPLLPRWGPLVWENAVRDIVSILLPCNWLQCQENSLDPVHTEWLHGYYGTFIREQMEAGEHAEQGDIDGPRQPIDPRQFKRPKHLKIGFDVFKYGVIKRRVVEGSTEEDDGWAIGHPILFPNILLVGSPKSATLQFRVPMDDTNTYHVSIYNFRAAPGVEIPRQEVVPHRRVPLYNEDGTFASQNIQFHQDYQAWASQGPIALRDLERLGESDIGIIRFRQLLKDQMELVQDGGDPMNTFRDASTNVSLDDLPLERIRFASLERRASPDGSLPRQFRYFPSEAGESTDRAAIENVLLTWANVDPEAIPVM